VRVPNTINVKHCTAHDGVDELFDRTAKLPASPFLPANVLGEGLRLLAESSILLSFETDFAGG
jgi:hypothetical protein